MSRHRAAGAILFAMLAGILLAPQPARAQGPADVIGGFGRDSGPINITADSLAINDAKKTATYRGNVVAVQGDNTLRTIELEVFYASADDGDAGKGKAKTGDVKPAAKRAKAAPDEDNQQIKRIRAKQKVVMVSKPTGKEEQSATSDEADYDVPNQMVELRGHVYITQGKNVIQGSKVTMNLRTSEYTVDGAPIAGLDGAAAPKAGEKGRVSTVLFPKAKDDGKAGAKAGADKAGAAKPAADTTPAAAKPATAKGPASSSWTTDTERTKP